MDYFTATEIFISQSEKHRLSVGEIALCHNLLLIWNGTFRKKTEFQVNNSMLRKRLNITQETLLKYQKNLFNKKFLGVFVTGKDPNVTYSLDFLYTEKIGIDTEKIGIEKIGIDTEKIGIDTEKIGIYTSIKDIKVFKETTTTKKGENFEKNNFENLAVGAAFTVAQMESEKEEKSCAKKEENIWTLAKNFQIKCVGRTPHTAGMSADEISAIFGVFQRANENNPAFENKSAAYVNDRFTAFCVNQKKNAQTATLAVAQQSEEEKPLLSVLDCIKAVKKYFETDPDMKEICLMTARFTEGADGNFEDELRNFCVYNANRFEFLLNPIKGMPHIFTKWLTHAKVFNKPKPNYSTTKNTQNEQPSNRNQRNGHTFDREQSNLILDRFNELVRSGKEAFPMA